MSKKKSIEPEGTTTTGHPVMGVHEAAHSIMDNGFVKSTVIVNETASPRHIASLDMDVFDEDFPVTEPPTESEAMRCVGKLPTEGVGDDFDASYYGIRMPRTILRSITVMKNIIEQNERPIVICDDALSEPKLVVMDVGMFRAMLNYIDPKLVAASEPMLTDTDAYTAPTVKAFSDFLREHLPDKI